MNDDPTNKPVRELLQDISKNTEPLRAPPRGLINPKLMDRVTFVASIVSLVIVAVTLIGMVWSTVDEVFGFRFSVSIGIFMLTLLAFRAINSNYE